MRISRVLFGAILLATMGYGGLQLGRAAFDGSGESETAAAGRADDPIRVRTETVRHVDVSDRVRAVGTTRALRSVELFPMASGRVEEIVFRAGQLVEMVRNFAAFSTTSRLTGTIAR